MTKPDSMPSGSTGPRGDKTGKHLPYNSSTDLEQRVEKGITLWGVGASATHWNSYKCNKLNEISFYLMEVRNRVSNALFTFSTKLFHSEISLLAFSTDHSGLANISLGYLKWIFMCVSCFYTSPNTTNIT